MAAAVKAAVSSIVSSWPPAEPRFLGGGALAAHAMDDQPRRGWVVEVVPRLRQPPRPRRERRAGVELRQRRAQAHAVHQDAVLHLQAEHSGCARAEEGRRESTPDPGRSCVQLPHAFRNTG